MKLMKKFGRTVIACMLMCGILWMPIFADTAAVSDQQPKTSQTEQQNTAALLSPAIAILAAKTTMLKNGVCGEAVIFSQNDFAKVLGYQPTAVTIASLPEPSKGTLRLGTLELQAGQTLAASTLNHLSFVPISATEATNASFTFTAEGKAYETDTALTCAVHVLTVKNEAPTAEDSSISTFTEIPVYASLHAADPEQDALTYAIVRTPKKGSVTLDPTAGTFSYTPYAGKKGSDVFTYRVTDMYGNESDLCKVTLSIRKPDTDIQYSDLDGHWAACAAIRCAEENLLIGEKLGSQILFHPEKEVTRCEFLVMAMQAAHVKVTNTNAQTVFADHAEIPEYARPYVQTAYEMGIINGTASDTEYIFDPHAVMTRAEAAVILNRLLGIDTPVSLPVFADADAIPAWSTAAMYALHSAGILSGSADSAGASRLNPTGTLDRAQTAQILTMVLDYKQ